MRKTGKGPFPGGLKRAQKEKTWCDRQKRVRKRIFKKKPGGGKSEGKKARCKGGWHQKGAPNKLTTWFATGKRFSTQVWQVV